MRALQGSFRVLVVLVLWLSLAAAPAIAGVLSSELFPVHDSVTHAGEGVSFRFTLTNIGNEDVFILSYETPLRGFERDLMRVWRDGEPIPYTGLLALRIGPSEDDWIRLPAGESVSGEFDLAESYDLRRSGTYTVQFQSLVHIFRGSDRWRAPVARPENILDLGDEIFRNAVTEAVEREDLVGVAVHSAPATVILATDLVIEFPDQEPPVGIMAFYGCSNTSTLTSAQSTARSRAARAHNAIPSYNTFYRTWFGTTSSYVSTVRGRFANSYHRLGATVDYYCGSYAPYCQSNYIAYTYKTTSNRIYICPAFWNQNASGRAHTIAHESFHWNTVAGADDVTYGYTNCINLAKNRPYDALRNADNYAYATTYAP